MHVTSPELEVLYKQVRELRDARRALKTHLGYALVLGNGLKIPNLSTKVKALKGIRERLASELHAPITHKFKRRSVFINALR